MKQTHFHDAEKPVRRFDHFYNLSRKFWYTDFKEVIGMSNELFQYMIQSDPLSERLYHYRLKAFCAGRILAQAEENPQSYVHLFRVNYVGPRQSSAFD